MFRDSDEKLVDWQTTFTNMPKFDCMDRNPRRKPASPCSFEARAVECTFVTGALKRSGDVRSLNEFSILVQGTSPTPITAAPPGGIGKSRRESRQCTRCNPVVVDSEDDEDDPASSTPFRSSPYGGHDQRDTRFDPRLAVFQEAEHPIERFPYPQGPSIPSASEYAMYGDVWLLDWV